MSVDSCRVHGLKNTSKFQHAVDQLRREKEFSLDILHRQLPKKCCSCFGESPFKRLTLELLREICLDLTSAANSSRGDKETTKLISTTTEKSRKKRMLKHDVTYDLKTQLDEYSDESLNEYSDDEEDANVASLATSMGRRLATLGSIVRPPHTVSSMARHAATFASMAGHTARFRSIPRRPHFRQFNQRCSKIAKRDPVLLKSFKVIQAPDSCIVHNRKYLSQFHGLVNLFRCTYDFPNAVYRQLPSVSCSCEGRTGLHVIDPVVLHKMCDEIHSNSTVKKTSEEPFNWLVVQYEEKLDHNACHAQIGRFIGRNGSNLRLIQDECNIRLHIIDQSSSPELRERLDAIRAEYGIDSDDVFLSFTKRNQTFERTITAEEIEQRLLEAWNVAKEDVPPERKSPNRRRLPVRARLGVNRRRFR